MDSDLKGVTPNGPWRSALALGLVAFTATALLAAANQLTWHRIEEQERRAVLRQLGQLIPPERYDNALYEDFFTLKDEVFFPGGQTVTVYRARKQSEPTAAVFRLAAMDGYNGSIHLLVGVNSDGTLSGVRISSHKETPGLGDAIEPGKSDWILSFTGLSLQNPGTRGWAVRRDGGVFDQFSGATITPRAVVKAVRMTLEFFAANKHRIFDHEADKSITS